MTHCQQIFNKSYCKVQYWEQRYKNSKSQCYEWLLNWKQIKSTVEKYLKKDFKILNLGCGNSHLQIDMQKQNYNYIVSIDISETVIKQKISNTNSNLKYYAMDITDAVFQNKYFDAVIDKSTIDSICCSQDRTYIEKSIKQIRRILKDKGILISVSYAAPQIRLKIFKEFNVIVESHEDIFIYICKISSEQEKIPDQEQQQMIDPNFYNIINIKQSP